MVQEGPSSRLRLSGLSLLGPNVVRMVRLELTRTRHYVLSVACLPFHHIRIVWWRRWDSNPQPSACKAGALPVVLLPRNLEGISGFEPELSVSKTEVLTFTLYPNCLAGLTGVEPVNCTRGAPLIQTCDLAPAHYSGFAKSPFVVTQTHCSGR